MHYAVRIYELKEGVLDDWVREWREVVVPLRKRFDFRVVGAWASADGRTFVWVLEHDGDDPEAANAAYYNSPERVALDPDPARHLESVRELAAHAVESIETTTMKEWVERVRDRGLINLKRSSAELIREDRDSR